jgi:UDPglucose--hexose-1-phosphate uridylyltransferase
MFEESMEILPLRKPDGRKLFLYRTSDQGPFNEKIQATAPQGIEVDANPQLRWHPLRGEWVVYADHRQNRTFLPPKEYNPLSPTRTGAPPTELPAGVYDMAVFENLFPSLSLKARALSDHSFPAKGVCEVVVFTQESQGSLGDLPLAKIELLFEIWGHRTRELGTLDEISYVMPFENRGVEVGVTLHHPHGQIYAYPVIPPIPARMLGEQQKFFSQHQRTLLQNVLEVEMREKLRVIVDTDEALAFVPSFARYPYEVWIAPKSPTSWISELGPKQRRDLARCLKTVLKKYEGLWNRPFPYLMTLYQAPTDKKQHPESHLHLEFSPPYRTRDKLKYLAGTEIGAGIFVNDSLPEAKAQELRDVKGGECD